MNKPKYTPEMLKTMREVWEEYKEAKADNNDIAMMNTSSWIGERAGWLLGYIDGLQEVLDFNPRAKKLAFNKKYFVVVSHTEPYFNQVYNLIRSHEISKGTWTEEDELQWNIHMKPEE